MWIEETKNGMFKFVEQYTDYITNTKKRVSVTMEKNTAAIRRSALEELTRKIEERQSFTSNENLTLRQLVGKYRSYQLQTVKPSTYTRNFYACESLLRILGEDSLANRINASYIKDKFLASGKSNGTLNEHRTRLKALLTWAFENDYLNDITFLLKFKPFKDISHKEKIQDKFLEGSEVQSLLEYMQSSRCPHWYYVTQFLVLSGLRIGELVALSTKDVDLKSLSISVTKTYDPINKIVTRPKTLCSIRDVHIQPEFLRFLKRLSIFTKEQKLLYGWSNPNHPYFPSESGSYINYYSFLQYLSASSIASIGKRITVHTLRHTHASLLLEQGVSVDAISRRLGHDNSDITKEIYLHITKKLQEHDNIQLDCVKMI